MQIVYDIEKFIRPKQPLLVGLGNFDGVHRGHRSLIEALVASSHDQGGVATGFVFEPHPARVLIPDRVPRLLVTPARKAELLEALGLDILIYAPFTRELAQWSPSRFVQEILVQRLQIKEAFVGFNYSFGFKGAGTPQLLARLGQKCGYGVKIIPPYRLHGEIVSSSLIRSMIEAGKITHAHELLGYPPMIEGIVVEGEHRGTGIGFPTANLDVAPELTVPGVGVYVAQAVIDGENYLSVVNIGSKPTFHEHFPITIEAHILNFNHSIYGKYIRLFFLDKIREGKKFLNAAELVEQIKRDCEMALELGREI